MSGPIACALCGTTTNPRMIGSAGCVCYACMSEAIKQIIIQSTEEPRPPRVAASDRCVLCGDPITKGMLAVSRGPYCICAECLIATFEGAMKGRGEFVEVRL